MRLDSSHASARSEALYSTGSVTIEQEHARDEDERRGAGREVADRNQSRTQSERSVSPRMLHGAAAFVGCDGRRRDAARGVDRVAQIDGHRLRVEMVGQVTRHMGDLHVADTVVAQHLFGYLGARQPAWEGHPGVFGEDRLQTGLYDPAHDADHDNENPRTHRSGRHAVEESARVAVVSGLDKVCE